MFCSKFIPEQQYLDTTGQILHLERALTLVGKVIFIIGTTPSLGHGDTLQPPASNTYSSMTISYNIVGQDKNIGGLQISGPYLAMCLFVTANLKCSSFTNTAILVLSAPKLLISLISHFMACSPRIAIDRQTQTKYFNPRCMYAEG